MIKYVTNETRENFMDDVGARVFYSVIAIMVLLLGIILLVACYSRDKAQRKQREVKVTIAA